MREKIYELCPKAVSVEYVRIKYKLAWVKVNYADEYDKL